MLGCTNPAAENYNEIATEDDNSCVYLVSMEGQCLQFEDIAEKPVDESFTLSFDTVDKQWAFFHDYQPDFYIHTRQSLYNIKNSKIYKHNEGPRGLYYDRTQPAPFFIDVAFVNKDTATLNAVKWISEVRAGGSDIDDNSAALYNETITAITIWNNYQCSGRIVLDKNKPALMDNNNRNSLQNWSFNDFRDITLENVQFLDNLFNDFKVLPNTVKTSMPWFDKSLIEGKYFIVRFEFSNTADKQITLHDMDISTDITPRA